MTTKLKKIFWLSPVRTQALEHKIQALLAAGYHVIYCEDVQGFLIEFNRMRAGIVLISDNYPEESLALADLRFLANMQELGGVRFILVPELKYNNCMSFAACLGFRDIIPIDLGNSLWMSRFLYSTSGAPTLWGDPLGKISLDEPCKVSTPGRLIWFSEKEIRIECKLEPVLDVPLRITGPIVKALDADSIRFYPTAIDKQNLIYRFSRGLVGKYHIENGRFAAIQEVLSHLDGVENIRRCKVFIAISTGILRKSVISALDTFRFDVSVALHRHSISSDPIYFCPHVIILEDVVCQGINQPEFESLLKNIGKTTPLVILGKNIDEEKWLKRYPNNRLFFESQLPIDFVRLIFEKYLGIKFEDFSKKREEHGVISADHDFSYVNIHFDAKLTQIHPLSLSLVSEAHLLPYSLCKIRTPSLNQKLNSEPYLKVTDTFYQAGSHNDTGHKEIRGYICTANKRDGEIIADIARDLLHYQLKDYFIDNGGAERKKLPTLVEATLKPATSSREKDEELAIELPDFSFADFFQQIRDYLVGKESQTLRYFLVFVLVTGFAIGVIWGLSSILAPRYEKSGRQYTEELQKFKKNFGH